MLGRRGAAVVAVRDEGTHLLRGTAVGLRIDEAVLLRPTDVELTAAECVVLRGPNGSGQGSGHGVIFRVWSGAGFDLVAQDEIGAGVAGLGGCEVFTQLRDGGGRAAGW